MHQSNLDGGESVCVKVGEGISQRDGSDSASYTGKLR